MKPTERLTDDGVNKLKRLDGYGCWDFFVAVFFAAYLNLLIVKHLPNIWEWIP